jgi:hypothetical protein
MFFTPDSAHGSFVVHFTNDPASDFGIWASPATQGRLAASATLYSLGLTFPTTAPTP